MNYTFLKISFPLILLSVLFFSCKRTKDNFEFKKLNKEIDKVENKISTDKKEVVEISYKNLSCVEEFEVAEENLRRWKNYMNKILDSCHRNFDDLIDMTAKEYTLSKDEILNLKKKYHDHLDNSQKNWSNYINDVIQLDLKYEIPGCIGSGTDFIILKSEVEFTKQRVEQLKNFIWNISETE